MRAGTPTRAQVSAPTLSRSPCDPGSSGGQATHHAYAREAGQLARLLGPCSHRPVAATERSGSRSELVGGPGGRDRDWVPSVLGLSYYCTGLRLLDVVEGEDWTPRRPPVCRQPTEAPVTSLGGRRARAGSR